MNKVGFFGTCRVKIINTQDDFKKIKFDDLPYVYKNNNIQINIRPLGYTTTTSDIYQNLSLIHSNVNMYLSPYLTDFTASKHFKRPKVSGTLAKVNEHRLWSRKHS